jgi:hypothetical protein
MKTKHPGFFEGSVAGGRFGVLGSKAAPRARSRRSRAFEAARRAAALVALVALPGVALGATATVKGHLAGTQRLVNPAWNEAKEPGSHRYQFREPSPAVRQDVRTTLTGYLPKELCIVALGDKGTPNKLPLRVVVAGGRTSPVTLVVAPGQQILFENQDPFPHKLYDTGTGGLAATDTAAAKSRTWTPPGPGKYEIRDKLAPSVRSWIVVEPRAVQVAYPDRKLDFAIDLEPGKYKLRGYFSGEPVGTELEVQVGAAEQLLKVPLVVGEVPAPAAPAAAGGAKP